MDSSQYNTPIIPSQSSYPLHRPTSPSISRDTYMPSNAVPIYRHGRKFYVSVEEFERIRDDERRHRRNLMQKSQNLPPSKSNPLINNAVRTTAATFYKPIQRSLSQPRDVRYGVLRAPHMPTNPIPLQKNDRAEGSLRPSRSTLKYYDDREDTISGNLTIPVRLPTTATRSNSSDRVVDLRRPAPIPPITYTGYLSDDTSVKRSLSAELIQATPMPEQQPPIPLRRPPPTPSYDYNSPPTNTTTTTNDQNYVQSTAAKLSNYFNRMPASTLNASMKMSPSNLTGMNTIYRSDMGNTDHFPSNRRNETGLARSSSNHLPYENYVRDTNIGSFSDDNTSSPTMLIQRRNTDRTRNRRAELLVETDEDYEAHGQVWARNTARSQSNEGLTEKKRVRFADTEGLTLETVTDTEQRRPPTDDRGFIQRAHVESSSDVRRTLQPFRNSFYQNNPRVGGAMMESKLATDV